MFELDLRSRRPIYEQLMDKIKEAVLYGVLKQDEQLPSVRTLSTQLTVNPNTVQKAYRELEREGYIYSLPGKGSFVSPGKAHADLSRLAEVRQELAKLMEEAARLGMTQDEILSLYQKVQAASNFSQSKE
ncbi:GntR family transcriptional regulator [Paenibacillus sp. YN15]|uniref:GntR family transcriptional regulator n=1 Tax=Paenibacillus sp. YN15 TaxID=1742774 RepID=UPI000DCE74C6|nr:GntR family transcriptional regulator [Paenibacillus sp. YN15]RAU92838.1 GntR family transcriptional regulator [Paenibacillus sp. YN15]